MAKTDRSVFLGQLRESERAMDVIFSGLARDISQVVIRAAGREGTVPIERWPELRKEVHRLVDAAFVDGSGRGFDEDNRPLAPFPRVISEGQEAMIDLAMERQAAILDRVMPEDVRDGMRRRWEGRGAVTAPRPEGRGF